MLSNISSIVERLLGAIKVGTIDGDHAGHVTHQTEHGDSVERLFGDPLELVAAGAHDDDKVEEGGVLEEANRRSSVLVEFVNVLPAFNLASKAEDKHSPSSPETSNVVIWEVVVLKAELTQEGML